MLRVLFWLFSGGLLTACSSAHTDRFALVQNPNVELETTLRRGPQAASFYQTYSGIKNEVSMDAKGNLRRHVLRSGESTQTSYRDGEELVLPLGRIPAPATLHHLSSMAVLPVLVPELRNLDYGAQHTSRASTAPAGDLVEIQWICSQRNRTERHYVARFEVTTAELRYERRWGRWRLASAEYSEREFVQRWNRIPKR